MSKPRYRPAAITTRIGGKETTWYIRDWRATELGYRPAYVSAPGDPSTLLRYATRSQAQAVADDFNRKPPVVRGLQLNLADLRRNRRALRSYDARGYAVDRAYALSRIADARKKAR